MVPRVLSASPERPTEATPDRRIVWAVLTVATLAAAALRLPFLSHQSLWFDEVFTRAVVARHSLTGMWHQIKATESTPPLYYLLAKLSSDIAGAPTAAALRAPPALALTASVPVAYLALRRLIGVPAALASAAFVALNPLLVSYSTDARSYGLLVLTALLSLWGFSAAREDGNLRAYAGWAIASIACVWSHYFGGFVVIGEAAALLICSPPPADVTTVTARLRTLLAGAVIVAATAPLLPLLIAQNGTEDAAFIAGISLGSRLLTTIRNFGMGPNVPRAWLEVAGLLILGAGVLAGLAPTLRRAGGRALITVGLATFGLPLLLALLGIEDRFFVRNVIAAVPMAGAVAAPALLRTRGVPLGVYLALALLASLWVATDWRYEQVDWRGAVRRAEAIAPRAAVVATGTDARVVAGAYLRRPATGTTVTRQVWLIVEPARGPGRRALGPVATPPALLAGLAGFSAGRQEFVHGFHMTLLRAPRPVAISAARIAGATLFGPPPPADTRLR
jgi:4-amino-4-deoxy-L-arabinose transferase-like glycosyltransferase